MHPTVNNLQLPVYLMNFPMSVDNRVVNNIIMQEHKQEKYYLDLAFRQWGNLYNYLTIYGMVYILPSKENLQDQTFVANLGCYLPSADVMVLSNFKSEPRQGEEKIGLAFFELMGYNVIRPPSYFEGEAELKYIRDNIYVGGYGVRTEGASYDWIMDNVDVEITPVEVTDPYLYHFDCSFLLLTEEKALVVTEGISKEDLRAIEKVVEVIPVPKKNIYDCWTNSVRIRDKILHSPVRPELQKDFTDFMTKLSLEPIIFPLSEFEKSGASLSCLIMHLNYASRYDCYWKLHEYF
jgi:N-dimethylarginine dimethylaminohydrolase